MPSSRVKPDRLTKYRRQYAALPVRTAEEGLQVLLLTSRGTKRWIIPKGWKLPKRPPVAAAVNEAYEEAGLEGTIEGDGPIGQYCYDKGLGGCRTVKVRVDVFLLLVSRQLPTWPEQGERETRWFDPEQAARLVAEPELAALLRSLPMRPGIRLDLLRTLASGGINPDSSPDRTP